MTLDTAGAVGTPLAAPRGWPEAGSECASPSLEPTCGYLYAIPALLRCEGGIWAGDPCFSTCSATGACSGGCAVVDGRAACVCIPPGPTCGGRFCEDQRQIVRMEDGTPVVDMKCDDQCRIDTNSLMLGCATDPRIGDIHCNCASVGDPCDDTWPGKRCAGEDLGLNPAVITTTTLARCQGGLWVAESCSDACGSANAYCVEVREDAGCVC